MRHAWLALFASALLPWQLCAADDEYRTVETAIRASMKPSGNSAAAISGHLGVMFKPDSKEKPVIEEIEANSAAAKVGLKAGDTLTAIDGRKPADTEEFRTVLRAKGAGERVKLSYVRNGKSNDVTVILPMHSRPLVPIRTQPTLLGVEVTATRDAEGVLIDHVMPGTSADRSKLKVGERILKVDDVAVDGPDKLREIFTAKKPDDIVNLTLLVAEKKVQMKLKLEEAASATSTPGGRRPGSFGRSRYWTKPVFRIAIILVEYPDAKHDAKITPKAWEDAMFSTGTFKKYVSGAEAFGSMNDYYMEQSHGQLKIEGKAFDYVELSKKKMDYNTGPRTLLTEAMDLVLKRDGKDALKDFDGVFFIYAGRTGTVPRGSLYWPHKSNVSHGGKRWPYFICPEVGRQGRGGGQAQMANISVFCHEFGHILGLPDLYARPENPGMEGAGIWSAMANQAGNGRPQHFDAWSKEKLGWIKPVPIDPTVKQKLILAPMSESPKECFKILAQPDGSEYFLLENRLQKGFDKSLPAEGLLIWRVIGNRPILEESHGVTGPQGPRLFSSLVPFPSESNRAFTPFTIPSSRSQLPDGLPVFITNIQKRPDGKISFHVGYEYQ